MADKKYISSTKTFYKFLRRVEKGDLVTDGPWQQKKGRPKKDPNGNLFTLKYSMPLEATRDHPENEKAAHGCWKGQIILRCAPVNRDIINDLDAKEYIMKKMTDINICKYLHNDASYRTIHRLYFDPENMHLRQKAQISNNGHRLTL